MSEEEGNLEKNFVGIYCLLVISGRGEGGVVGMESFLRNSKSSHLTNLRALIVGAGVGGLVAARCLQAVGYEVCVIDRFTSVRRRLEIDRGILLHGKAREIFSHLGLSEELQKRSLLLPFCTYTDHRFVPVCSPSPDCPAQLRVASLRQSDVISMLLDNSLHRNKLQVLFNTQLGYVHNNTSTGLYGNAPLQIELIRSEDNPTSLSSLLSPSSSSEAVCVSEDVGCSPAGVQLSCDISVADGYEGEVFADVMIAADGTHSLARRQISPCSRRSYFQYMGTMAHHGIINSCSEHIAAQDDPIDMIGSAGNRFTAFPLPPIPPRCSPSSSPISATVDSPSSPPTSPPPSPCNMWWSCTYRDIFADARDAQTKRWGLLSSKGQELLAEQFAGFADPALTILDVHVRNATPMLSEYHFEDNLSEWSKNRVAFIGRAATACSPELLQGASLSVEDAWELSCSLSRMTNEDCIRRHLNQLQRKTSKGKEDLLSVANCLYKYGKLRIHRLREYNRVSKFVRWFVSDDATSTRLKLLPKLPQRFIHYCYDGYLYDSLGGNHFALCQPPPHFIEGRATHLNNSIDGSVSSLVYGNGVVGSRQSLADLDSNNLTVSQNRAAKEQGDVLLKWLRRIRNRSVQQAVHKAESWTK
eukprot:GHVS01064790.1.p1 GENE.GHVS01064790.1~~GHVS01064790.1.p1  ORF type:complete len:642 (+),score=123.34 GHVS01064790.1:88-2013(+)